MKKHLSKILLLFLLLLSLVFTAPPPVIPFTEAAPPNPLILVKFVNRTLSKDMQWGGMYERGLIGETVVFGDLCYYKSDGKWWKTDADAEATTEGVIGICIVPGIADANGWFLTLGYIRYDTWNWSASGAPLWVGNTAGAIVETGSKPAGSGDQIRKIGYTRSADIIYLFPDSTLIELP